MVISRHIVAVRVTGILANNKSNVEIKLNCLLFEWLQFWQQAPFSP